VLLKANPPSLKKTSVKKAYLYIHIKVIDAMLEAKELKKTLY
jgi:hypothetical protein